MKRVTHVFGPAYLDRVVLVDGPLREEGEPPLDQSVEGRWRFGAGLELVDPVGSSVSIETPSDWPGPFGTVELGSRLGGMRAGSRRSVKTLSWHDDLGGMGAGYASALGGLLVSALGEDDDAMTRTVSACLARESIVSRPIRIIDRPADWTLLVTSGPHGDKLPVGFRGCHSSVRSLADVTETLGPCDLRVAASFPNRLAAEALRAEGAAVRMFAPAMRNMGDADPPVGRFVGSIDILCCNRHEWEALADREQVAWQVSLLVVTDGPNGSTIRYTTPEGEAGLLRVPVFPRDRPPVDTNRAGEAYASALVTTLLDHGWTPGVTAPDLARLAGERASAAAALVLDRPDFGFASDRDIDEALRAGRVASRG